MAFKCAIFVFYAFFSDGLYEFAETFLDSLKFHHGDDIYLILETLDLSDSQVIRLKSSYGNLDLRNRPIDMERYAQILGVDTETVHRWKNEVENIVTSDENYHWKILMSVEERYRNVPRIAKEARAAGYKILLHTDIDMYFRKPLDDFIDIVRSHDVSIKFREESHKHTQVYGACMGFSLNDKSEKFLESWANQIDSIAPKNKPRGFGQISFYRAYLEHKETCNWGRFELLHKSLEFSKGRNPDADIWVGNSNQGRNRKSRTASIFAEDLKEMKRDPSSYVGSPSYRAYHFPSFSSQMPSNSFSGLMDNLRSEWMKILQNVQSLGRMPELDIFFTVLPNINALLQTNSCERMAEFYAPNPERFNPALILKDKESGGKYNGAQSYLGLKEVRNHDHTSGSSVCDSIDAVCVAGVLEHCPESDIYWLVDEAFQLGTNIVVFIIDLSKAIRIDFEWWQGLIAGVANRYLGVNYHIFALSADKEGGAVMHEAKRETQA